LTYLCVDGGQTKTAVMLLDESGDEVETWHVGALTTPWKSGAMDNLRDVVRTIAKDLGDVLESASQEPPEAACFSLTGYLQGDQTIPSLIQEEMERAVPKIGRIHTIPDYVGNWAAATGGEPGVMVIGGGGSVAYGRTGSGEALRIGGWGHLLGDEGSGFWIGLQAIKAALKSRAGVSAKTALEERVMQRFGADDDRLIIREVYSTSISEAEVAGLVPLVASLAQEGDGVAVGILDEAAVHLAAIALAVLYRLGDLPVYPSGGVFRAPTMRERFERALTRSEASVEVRDAVSDNPLNGVFLIAREGLAQ
jgi:N-acetylglucosamine kinase-like BadF-type ATPase